MKLPKNIGKPLLLLASVILLCTLLSRIFTSSETLADYAAKNPEVAYQEKESTEETSETNEDDASQAEDAAMIGEDGTATSQIDGNSGKVTDKADTDHNTSKASFTDEYENTAKRITLTDGFFYEPIPAAIQEKITGISYPKDALVSLDELRYLNVRYYDFNDQIQTGELICNASIAQDLLEIFSDLYKAGYQIEKIKLIDDYQGDDHLSMLDDNTSCFNYRTVDDTTKLSKHAYGLAIDINPYYNPYVTYENGSSVVSPEGSEPYADRTADFSYKIDANDLCYKLFKAHGFTWGGDWNSCKDYQHFQKSK